MSGHMITKAHMPKDGVMLIKVVHSYHLTYVIFFKFFYTYIEHALRVKVDII